MSPETKTKEVAPFLKNLRKMLDQESDEILRWTPNGRAFEIHDMERMMDYVLPKYFKHRKYTSFQRQLNYFNFKKWTKSKAAVCTFSNECFLRDQPDLAWRITRKKSVSSSSSSSSTSSSSSAATKQGRKAREPVVAWKAPADMAITVPCVKAEPPKDSFPSPTDMDMMLLESEVDVQRYYHYGAQGEDLDWIDHFLPSLELPPQPKMEDPYYLQLRHYPPASYHSLPPPSSFGCVL